MSDTTNTTGLRERLLARAERIAAQADGEDSGVDLVAMELDALLREAAAALSPPALDAPVVAPVAWISPNALAALDKCRNDDHNGCVDAWMRPTETYSIPVYASPVAAQAVTWQPIETAPTTKLVMVCVAGDNTSVGEAFLSERGNWLTLDAMNGRVTSYLQGHLTHWCEKPSAAALAHPNAAPCDAQEAES